jgi:hypothetical protein
MKCIATVLTAMLAAPIASQPLFREVTSTHLPAGLAGRCMDAAAGDVDGDGDLDLALAMEFEPKVLLVNDGAGRFRDASGQLPRAAHDSEDVTFADFDGDGDLDLVFVSEDDRQDELYLNDGFGRFVEASDRLTSDDVSNALVVVDLNADGAPDLMTGNIGVDRVLLNDGSGRFRDETAERWAQGGGDDSRTQDLEAFDMDGDGDLDIAVANEGQNRLFRNDAGLLVDVTSDGLPEVEDESREIRAADFDGDGDLDLVVANVRFLLDRPASEALLLNDGRGAFTRSVDSLPSSPRERSHFTVQAADLDRDGDIDLILPSTEFARAAGDYRALLNDGRARFTPAEPGALLPQSLVGNGFDVEVADFDADGLADLFLCNRASGADAAESGGLQRLLLALRSPAP